MIHANEPFHSNRAAAMDPFSDEKIVDSWHTNAVPWMQAVRDGEIESRKLVTDRAILDAVSSRAPETVLDLGCGEGWLVRALADRGVHAIGVDVVPALIDAAITAGGGDFRIASYEDVAAGALQLTTDVVVSNFSLIGKESVESLIGVAPSLLRGSGAMIVQTLHPLAACGEMPYEDGWRRGSWTGFNSSFRDPAPWYFRTMESWIQLFTRSGLRVVEVREPLHAVSHRPASVIFVAEASG